jgi:hypothetical protein
MREVEAEDRVRSEIAIRIAVRRRLDLDYPRAEIAEQGGGIGTGNKGRTFDNRDIFEKAERHA